MAPSPPRPAPRRVVSIRAIAKRAGVSMATVSRVVNGIDIVKPETRRRVEAVIAKTGYRRNVLGRNLRTAESRLLLTMVPDFGNPFYAEIVRGIDAVAQAEGYHTLLADTGANLPGERTAFEMLHNRLADGAICLDPETTQRALAEETGHLCWVACCEFNPDMSVPYVGIDNEAAAYDAVTYLARLGRRRIAFVTSDERYMYARLRRKGYLRALADAGLEPLQGGEVVATGVRFEDGRRVEAYLREASPRPDAIFCVSDTLGIAAIHGAGGIGMRVPEDLAVIGFDDIAAATMIRPELTTVRQPMHLLGATAVNLLLKRLRNPRTPVSGVVLPHELVIRGSTG